MNDQLARSLFIDYLYDEITEEDKTKLETYLHENPKIREELNQLQETRSLLQKMPEADPLQKLLVMEPRNRGMRQWWQDVKSLLPQSFLGKTAFAAAAGFVLLLFLGSLAQIHIDTTGDGVTISLGYSPTVHEQISDQQANALVQQIRAENAAMLSNYAKALNKQNEQQLQQVVNYFQEQRLNDLQLVDQTLDEFQQNTNYRLSRTNQYLGEVLQTVSYQNQN